MGMLQRLQSAGLYSEFQSVLSDYTHDLPEKSEIVQQLEAAVDQFGLSGARVLQLVKQLTRDLKVKMGLYKKLGELANTVVTSTRGGGQGRGTSTATRTVATHEGNEMEASLASVIIESLQQGGKNLEALCADLNARGKATDMKKVGVAVGTITRTNREWAVQKGWDGTLTLVKKPEGWQPAPTKSGKPRGGGGNGAAAKSVAAFLIAALAEAPAPTFEALVAAVTAKAGREVKPARVRSAISAINKKNPTHAVQKVWDGSFVLVEKTGTAAAAAVAA